MDPERFVHVYLITRLSFSPDSSYLHSEKIMDISESYSIVYFNFYRGTGNQIVPKEMSISNSKLDTIKSWVFKPPTKWFELEKRQQRLNACLRRRSIHIRWEDGVTPFAD